MFRNIKEDFFERFPLVLPGDIPTYKDAKIWARFNHEKGEEHDLKPIIVVSENEMRSYEEL